MSLTMPPGPLSARPVETTNYRIDGPARRLYFAPFPRRIRARFGGRVILDSLHAMLLHETGELPGLYVPHIDVTGHLLEPSGTVAVHPQKGEAHFASVRVNGRVATDAVWSYPEPEPGAGWLRGFLGISFPAMDTWLDEDEEIRGGLRDPYHRVDVVPTHRRVQVTWGAQVLARTEHPMLVSETGSDNALYVPAEDVARDRFTPSRSTSVCPYKGTATYFDLPGVQAAAWCFSDPQPEAARIAGYWGFDPAKVEVTADTRAKPEQAPTREPEPPAGIFSALSSRVREIRERRRPG